MYDENNADLRFAQVVSIPESLGKFLIPHCAFHSRARERDLIFPPKRGFFRLSRGFWCAGCGCRMTWGYGDDPEGIEEFLATTERLAKELAARVGELAQ